MKENIHAGHRERLKNDIVSADIVDKVPTVKLLEMLLFYGVPQKDTAPIAHELLKTFGSLAGVFEAEIDDLVKIKGMTRNAACLIKLMRPIGREYVLSKYKPKETLTSSEDIGEYILTQYFGVNEETVSLLCLDRMGNLLAFEIVMKGSLDSVGVSPRTVVELAIKHKATAVVIAHNHPSGVAFPSRADVDATRELKRVLGGISVNLIDHIIIAKDDYISMAQSLEFEDIF